jgi:LTXXQ motif family protein
MHADMMQAMQTGSAMARMDALIKAMESMVESLKALKPSSEALYAVLTDEQKQQADRLWAAVAA